VWQLIVILLVFDGKFNIAFWAIAIPVYIYFCLDSPLNAVIFLLLFTLIDFVYLQRYYTYEHIYAISIENKTVVMNLVLISIMWILFLTRSSYFEFAKFKIDFAGKIILLMIGFILIKYCSTLGIIKGVLNPRTLQISLYLSLYFIYNSVLKSEKDMYHLFKWLWAGAIFVILYGCYQLISGNYTYIVGIRGLPIILNEGIVVNLYLIVFTLFVFLYQAGDFKRKLIAFIVVLLYFIVMTFTFKRAALVAGGIGFMFTLLLMQRGKLVKFILNIGIALTIVIFPIYLIARSTIISQMGFSHLLIRLNAISFENMDVSGAMRVAQWIKSIEIMKANPFWGLPALDKFTLSFGPYNLDMVLDSNYFFIGVYFGPVVLILYLLLIGYVLVYGIKSLLLSKENSFFIVVLIGSISALISLLVADLFEVNVFVPKKGPFYVLIIALILNCIKQINKTTKN